jgi:hypothetical protein
MDHHRDVPVTGAHPGGGREEAQPTHVPGIGAQPGGGREENPPEVVDPLLDPSHPANPLDGAPSPGPQPGSTVDHDADRRHPKHRDA